MAQSRTLETYLVVKPKGYYNLTARLASKAPALKADEVAIKLHIGVPDGLFKRPQLQASVTVPESAITPAILDAVVLDNVREALEQQLGFDVKLSVVEPDLEA